MCRCGRRRCSGKLLNKRRKGNADRLADGSGTSRRLGAQHETLVVLIDGDFLDAIEIAHDVGPFEIETGGGAALVELLAQDERKE
jgi:hypothetical protein